MRDMVTGPSSTVAMCNAAMMIHVRHNSTPGALSLQREGRSSNPSGSLDLAPNQCSGITSARVLMQECMACPSVERVLSWCAPNHPPNVIGALFTRRSSINNEFGLGSS